MGERRQVNPIILDDVALDMDVDDLADNLRVRRGGKNFDVLKRLVAEACQIGRPKALYREAYIDDRGDDYVVADGIRLTSRVLRVNLEHAHRIFPYTATCGTELRDWAVSADDLLERYWADAIQERALRVAVQALSEHFAANYPTTSTSTMSPGRLADWPLEEQRPLFSLLGDTATMIGVHLTDSMLMLPTKSVSGVRFPTEQNFESCELCPRERCPGRRAPYDPALYHQRYAQIAE
jgi:hypothetical protein